MNRSWASFLPLTGLLILGAASLTPPSDDPVPGWRYGPIRYILNVDEDKGYKALRTEDERRLFIQRFWAALDPTPATELNERRQEFWRRVEQANDLFHESVGPGWSTDRGKALILLGPPDKRTPSGPAELWIYIAIPGSHEPPEMQVRFQRNSSGQFHFVRGSLQYLDPLGEPGGAPAGDTYLAIPVKGGPPQILKERIRMTEFPSGKVTTQDFVDSIEVARQYSFYKAVDGSTYSELSLKIPATQFAGPGGDSQEALVNLSISVEDVNTTAPAKRLTETLQPVAAWSSPLHRTFLFRTGFSLVPGNYRVDSTLVAPKTRRGATLSEPLQVPDYRRAFSLSTVVLGRPAKEVSLPFSTVHPGMSSVSPDPETVFVRGETLALAYQVYNARHDPMGAPDLDIEYKFFSDIQGGPRQIGETISNPHQSGESLGYLVSLERWPPGSYLVSVRVTDRRADVSAARDARFRVLDGSAPTGPRR